MKLNQRLVQLARKELKKLERDVILKTNRGYLAFGKYDIAEHDGLYRVSVDNRFIGDFQSTKNAISYCIADHNEQYTLAIQIRALDERLQQTESGLITRRQVKQRDINAKMNELALVKVQHRETRKKWTEAELEKCIIRAKYLHQKGFSNETQRTSRTASHKIYY